MKKLLFATALVASAAAFADPTALNAISFEGYSADATFANGAAEKGEDGNDKSPGPFFYYDGDGDGSSVKTFATGDAGAATGVTRPFYFQGISPTLNYLELSTEGGTLWRSINPISSTTVGEDTTYGLGTAQAIAAEGTYLDTLVQFTPTEDGGAPELDAADKLAIWLNVDGNGVTNLMARAGWVDAMGQPVATNFVLTGTSVVAGEWYRLTVKVVPNIIDTEGVYGGFYNIPAFIIYVNGTEMAATTSPIDASLANLDGTIASGFATLVAANKVFPSIVPPQQGVAYALQGVGFKGSGALDDIVWTEEDPLAGGSSGDDYKVVIDGSDVVIAPQAGDLEALQAAIVAGGGTLDVTDVDAVNAALDAEIGSTGVKAWQALFLGLAPTEDGLAAFKIDSISFDGDGDVVVTLPAGVTLMTGRGVDITLKVMAAAEPNAAAADWDEASSATGSKTFPPITPAANATKEFYKVVVEFAASAQQ